MNWRTYLWPFTVPLVCALQLLLGERAAFLTTGFVFGVIPLIDALLPADTVNIEPRDEERVTASAAFRRLLYAAILADTAVLALGLTQAHRFGAVEMIGAALGVGLVTGGVGITVAHELLHKTHRTERFFAHLALVEVGYLHFVIEHVFGHHVRAATPDDPATARRGESVYAFVVRSVRDSWRSAWNLEGRRLARVGAVPFSVRNVMFVYTVAPLLLAIGVLRVLGLPALVLFVAQAVVAVVLLEIVNYIEHYGLVRARQGERYEPFGARHAWDSDAWLSNRILFRLSRHADHHRNAMRPYSILRRLDESPKMPTGYPGMMLLSLVPPLWRAVMHPRLRD